jgi:glycosyltransferase involved in cell wall biosynthesis
MKKTGLQPIPSLALISNNAFSLVNFRGPLIKALRARGVTVYALAPDYTAQTCEAIAALGAEPVHITLERTGMNPLKDARDILRLTQQLRRLGPDATLGYFIKPVIYGSLAARLAGVPRRYALVAGLGYAFDSNGQKTSLKRQVLHSVSSRLYRQAFRVCDRVFFQNTDDIEYFTQRRILDPRKAVRVNGTGVDLEHFAPAPPVTAPVTFLLMARLLRAKGICEFAGAARRIKAAYPESRFVLLGEPDSNPDSLTRAEVEAWVREGILEWPGQVQGVRPWIAQSSVYVLPSYYREGVPRSTQEAMAMGRPVITTDNTGCRQTVIDGVNGFLVPVRNAAALTDAMRKFIEQPALIETMGRESRRLAGERFDVHAINRRILAEMGLE